jgi:RNA polymerase sigma-70 factor (ECF subfamily)
MMSRDADAALTEAWDAIASGEPGATARFMPLLYERLRAIAASHLAGERTDHTLQATALVHEAFLRLLDRQMPYAGEAHFLAAASQAMRRILVDHARGRGRKKRGAGFEKVDLVECADPIASNELDLVELDDAIERLALKDQQSARVVELRFFAGMDEREVAEVLGVSDRSVRRYWIHAKAWLARELLGDGTETPA